MTDSASRKWRDLGPRVGSAIVLLAIGIAAIWHSHFALSWLILLFGFVAQWELWRMGKAKKDSIGLVRSDFLVLYGYAILIFLGVLGLVELSDEGGRTVIVFVIALVVITDTFGYLFGRFIGGPKFWPKVSPKKTWAGILAGWAGAGLLGLMCYEWVFDDRISAIALVLFAVALSFASQMGDFLESAIKRRMGVKDSSNLIPGHGGVLDRFDGLLALGALSYVLFWIFD